MEYQRVETIKNEGHLVHTEVSTRHVSRYSLFTKRIFDILFAVIGLLVLLLPMLVIGLLIKTTSRGPVLFKQTRYGLNSQPFTLLKFRSMRVNAPQKSNKEFGTKSMGYYITPIGNFLRKSSLDELPQLFNIFKGEMSFIGPRPMAMTDADVIKMRKSVGADKVRPGITGLAQVHGRNSISDEEKVSYDVLYASDCCLKRDLSIFLRSIVVVLKREGISRR